MGKSDYPQKETKRSHEIVRVGLSFTKGDRLLSTGDFKRVYRNGRKIVGPKAVFYYDSNNFNRHRLGITISRKAGNSVKRNRLKRLIREVFRLNLSRLKQDSYCDIVIVMRKAGMKSDFKDIEQLWLETMSKAGLLG
jgi:ribonuclease P protein component